MEELFETFDDNGMPTGLMGRSEVHARGIWHRAANVFLFRSDGRLIIQRRHPKKDIWPNAWDLSAAEHLKPGENFLQGALRGISEELGIELVTLEQVGEQIKSKLDDPIRHIRDYEMQLSFRGISDAEIIIQTDEVAETQTIELRELRSNMEASPEMFTPWFRERAHDLRLFET